VVSVSAMGKPELPTPLPANELLIDMNKREIATNERKIIFVLVKFKAVPLQSLY